MARKRKQQTPPSSKQAPERHPIADDNWDEVDQASWESFPASDTPSWAASPETKRRTSHPKPPDGSEPSDRHA